MFSSLPHEEGNPFVFVGGATGEPLSREAMRKLLKRMRPGLTVHGFRSTYRDWAAELTNHPREIAEAALAHTVGNAVERTYQRGDLLDKRCSLMDAWARYCGTTPVASESGAVVAMRR